jgi:hypothetical protein
MSLGRVAEGPQPLMCRDEAFQVPSSIAVRGIALHQDHLQNTQQSRRHLEVAYVAGLVKGDQDLAG